jgi:hypothetical protein
MRDSAPGTFAVCSASWPSEDDFGCGLQVSLASGTRSSTRRVVFASVSSSASRGSAMGFMEALRFSRNGFGPWTLRGLNTAGK